MCVAKNEPCAERHPAPKGTLRRKAVGVLAEIGLHDRSFAAGYGIVLVEDRLLVREHARLIDLEHSAARSTTCRKFDAFVKSTERWIDDDLTRRTLRRARSSC
jgi:hypothetical protein